MLLMIAFDHLIDGCLLLGLTKIGLATIGCREIFDLVIIQTNFLVIFSSNETPHNQNNFLEFLIKNYSSEIKKMLSTEQRECETCKIASLVIQSLTFSIYATE